MNETLLGAYPCALHFTAGLRQGVLYVSSGHLCFETAIYPAANTKLPFSRISTAERCRYPSCERVFIARRVPVFRRDMYSNSLTHSLEHLPNMATRRDPVFHLIPNSIRLALNDRAPPLTFASFHPPASRDEAIELLSRCLKSAGATRSTA